MNYLIELYQQLLAEDGSLSVAIRNKLVHIFVGALSGFVCFIFFHSILLSLAVALVLGIIREITKTTPLLLHIFTALLTGMGGLIAPLIAQLYVAQQLSVCTVMILYCAAVTVYQLYG